MTISAHWPRPLTFEVPVALNLHFPLYTGVVVYFIVALNPNPFAVALGIFMQTFCPKDAPIAAVEDTDTGESSPDIPVTVSDPDEITTCSGRTR